MSSSSSASFLSPHTVIFSPQIRPASPHQPPKTYNILFCPGNPGCIAYYHAFLAHFAEILASPAPLPSSSKLSTASTTSSPSASSTASTNASFNISASSFPNFVDDDDDETARNDGQKRPTGKLLDLSSLISHVYDQHLLSPPPHTDPTATPANTTPANTTSQETEKTLILIGHSVGAYIVMELLRRWLDEKKKKKERGQGTEGGGQVRVVGVIGLWPTIVSIGQSKRGKWARILLLLPSLPLLISLLAHALVYILGPSGVEWLVKHITGFSDDAVKTTAGFVGSRRGVRQAVYLARDEMRVIGEDGWEEEVWGVVGEGKMGEGTVQKEKGPWLRFLFGRDDHWVADEVRDGLMKRRAGGEGGVKMEIDEEGIPHSFCIRHSAVVAKKVAGWVKEIAERDQIAGQAARRDS